jgi:two-component system chemotaxis response regulator CheB
MPDVIVIGASWGGLTALRAVLGPLDTGLAACVLVVQHRGHEDGHLLDLLTGHCALEVREAEDKDALVHGHVLIAPRDYHLLVERDAVALSVDEPVRFSRPSIDVLFESAAALGPRVVGVVLTGSNADGAAGLAAIRRSGGLAIVQDPADAERAEMPAAALAAVPDAQVRRLEEIGSAINALCRRGGDA